MNSNLNLNTLPECKFAYRMVNSALLIPCIEYQRMLRMEKVSQIAENFSEYIANEPKVSYRDGRFYVFDGQNTVEARRTCNGGKDVTIRCKVFYGLTKEDEATLFAIQTGNATCLTAGERLRANLVAENPDALYFVGITSNAGVEFAYDGIRAPWKIYCIETAYELYKQYGCERYVEMLHIINEAWKGNVDSYLAGVIRGVARFATVHDAIHIRAVHEFFQDAELLFGGRRHQILPLLRQDGQVCDAPLDVFGIINIGRCQFHQMTNAPADEIAVALKVAVLPVGRTENFCIGHSDGWLFRHD